MFGQGWSISHSTRFTIAASAPSEHEDAAQALKDKGLFACYRCHCPQGRGSGSGLDERKAQRSGRAALVCLPKTELLGHAADAIHVLVRLSLDGPGGLIGNTYRELGHMLVGFDDLPEAVPHQFALNRHKVLH